MREFFKGWRRKLGSVALVMACLLSSGWIRSDGYGEFVESPRLDEFFIPFERSICAGWYRRQIYLYSEFSLPHGARLISYEIMPEYRSGLFDGVLTPASQQQIKFLGVELIAGRYHLAGNVFALKIPFGFVVLPLTLLSAYLILWKPRKAS